jgi:hypothetical protein
MQPDKIRIIPWIQRNKQLGSSIQFLKPWMALSNDGYLRTMKIWIIHVIFPLKNTSIAQSLIRRKESGLLQNVVLHETQRT